MRILILVLVLCFSLGTNARRYRPIAKPLLEKSSHQVSPGKSLVIKGSGFIANYPRAHKLMVKQGKKKHRLEVLSVNASTLYARIPENLSYGDYQLKLRLKSKFLRSPKTELRLAVKPQASPAPRLKFQVASNKVEIEELIETKSWNGHELQFDHSKLKTGINQVFSYYSVNGHQSITSQGTEFYYLPETDFFDPLEIKSEQPLDSYATSSNGNSYQTSLITKFEEQDLEKHFFLTSPHKPRYLEKVFSLSPIYIKELHVLEPEHIVLGNRSSKDFSFSNCHLDDSVKTRFNFTEKSIQAKSQLQITQNLGLNNTSPDTMKLICDEELIDEFSYSKLDTTGLAIRL